VPPDRRALVVVLRRGPLAEAWDSGASAWTPERREAYANDQGAEESLVVVTDSINQAKGDKDPAGGMLPAAPVHCRYVAGWVGTKLRWSLTADDAEAAALRQRAAGCPLQTVTYRRVL
jgi:hypothetical protein